MEICFGCVWSSWGKRLLPLCRHCISVYIIRNGRIDEAITSESMATIKNRGSLGTNHVVPHQLDMPLLSIVKGKGCKRYVKSEVRTMK